MNAKYHIAKNRWNGMFSSLLMIYNSTCMPVYSIASFSIIFVSNLFHFYLLLLYSQMFVWKCFRKSLRTHYTSHTHPSKPTIQVGMYHAQLLKYIYFLYFLSCEKPVSAWYKILKKVCAPWGSLRSGLLLMYMYLWLLYTFASYICYIP